MIINNKNLTKEDIVMKNMQFTLWDIEHGISIWLRTPNGHNHCFDLGKTSEFSPSTHVAQKYGVKEIDYLVISHPDRDHIEDLPNFMQKFRGPRVLCRNSSLPDKEFSGSGESEYQQWMQYLHRRFIYPVPYANDPANPSFNGGIEYKHYDLQYGQFPDGSKLEGNNTSIVTVMLYQGVLFVCPGDIEPKGWEELWNQNKNSLKDFITKAKYRFLVAPHHGRESGYSKEMMDSVQPHVVFISDKWGDSSTHSAYYSKPLGLAMSNNQVIKCLSTKTKGRILCEVNSDGSFLLNHFDNEKTKYDYRPSPDMF